MRIGLIQQRVHRLGGTEAVVANLAPALADRGHQVELVTARCSLAPAEGLRIHRVAMPPLGGWLRDLAFSRGARRAASGLAVDHWIHFGRTEPLAPTGGRQWYRAGGGCHTCYRRHCARPGLRERARALQLREAHWAALERRLFTLPVIAPSPLSAERIRACHPEARVHVVDNGVDLTCFAPERGAWPPGVPRPAGRIALWIGSDPWRKGLDRLLAALRLPASRDWSAVLVGDSRRIRRALLPGDRVVVLEPLTHIETLYPEVDCVVLPTRHDPFANVTLEALASGTPVITTAANGAAASLAGPALRLADAPATIAEQLATLPPTAMLRAAARASALPFSLDVFVTRLEATLQMDCR